MKLNKLLPLKEWEITVRVDQLLRAQKSVETILTKNANKHSKEFMEGMDLVKGVENDLIKSKEIVAHTKNFLQNMQAQVVVSSMDIMKLHRRRKRLEVCRKILVDVYKKYHEYTLKINELLLHSEYFDALNLIDKALEELETLPKEVDFAAIHDIRRKLKNKRELIAKKTSEEMGDIVVNFNPALYSKCLKTFKVKAGEKSDPRMAGRKQGSRTKILFEVTFIYP
jgi:hypothetical protein